MTDTTTIADSIALLLKKIEALNSKIINSDALTTEEGEALRAQRKVMKEDLQEMYDIEVMSANRGARLGALDSAGGSARSDRVPSNLPFFQWEGFIRDKSKADKFRDVEDALQQFEVVVRSWKMDLDLEWQRLLPLCLPRDLREWLEGFYASHGGDSCSWAVVKEAMMAQYGLSKEQVRFDRIRKFLACSKKADESMEAFIVRFKELKTLAEVSNKLNSILQ